MKSAGSGKPAKAAAAAKSAKPGKAAAAAKPGKPAKAESHLAMVRRARRINRELAEVYPYAHPELDFRNPFELLVATVLSAQTTDLRVNQTTPALFAEVPDPRGHGRGRTRRSWRRSSGRPGSSGPRPSRCIGLSAALRDDFGGEVPGRLEDLVTLPGVGRKTANVVLGNAFGVPGITVDTHFGRLVRRWKWTEQEDPEKVEAEIAAIFPKSEWTMLSHRVDLPRPPHLPRPQARLRRLPDRPALPVVRGGRDGPGEGEEAAEVRDGRPAGPAAEPAAGLPGQARARRWAPGDTGGGRLTGAPAPERTAWRQALWDDEGCL